MIFSENPGDLGSGWGKGRRHRKLPWGPSAAAFLTGKRLACSFLKGLNFCQRRWSLIHLVSNHSLWGWTKRHQGHFQFPSSSTCSQTNSATYGRWTHLHTPSAFLGSLPSNNLYLLFFFLALSKHAFPKTLGSPTFGASFLFLRSSTPFKWPLVWPPCWLKWDTFPRPSHSPLLGSCWDLQSSIFNTSISDMMQTKWITIYYVVLLGLAQSKGYMLLYYYKNSVNKILLHPERSRLLTIQLRESEVLG